MPPTIAKLKVGDRLLVETFAGVDVEVEVVRIDKDSAEGCLIHRHDVAQLKEAGVPYTKKDVPRKCTGIIFEHQIIKRLRRRKKRK